MSRLGTVARVLVLLVALYVFLVSISLLGSSVKLMTGGLVSDLIASTSNPFVGLLIGILVTSLIHSSSTTTSIVVALVGGGVLSITQAIPIVIGSNIGTTCTNMMVSFAHIRNKEEFRRAFGGAAIHDVFNVLTVIMVLPLEIHFHFLEKTALALTDVFFGTGGMVVASPLKMIVKPVENIIIEFMTSTLALHPGFVTALALIGLFAGLGIMVTQIRSLVERGMQTLLHKYLFRSHKIAFLLGLGLTAVIQSSGVTTSLVVPLIGAGVLTLEQIVPYLLGANIGTTVTAILASLATGSKAAVAVAFVHTLFNAIGAVVWYPLRRVPLFLVNQISKIAFWKRRAAVGYVVFVFYIIPIILITVFR